MHNTLAIDPGGTTGIAMTADGVSFLTFTTDTPEHLWEYVAGHSWNVVLCERFKTAGQISKYGLYTTELVGGTRALCYFLQMKFEYREPQHRRAWQSLAQAYLEKKGEKFVVHEADALAHLMAWIKWVPS